MIELACRSAECAPPPVGVGGSSPATTVFVRDWSGDTPTEYAKLEAAVREFAEKTGAYVVGREDRRIRNAFHDVGGQPFDYVERRALVQSLLGEPGDGADHEVVTVAERTEEFLDAAGFKPGDTIVLVRGHDDLDNVFRDNPEGSGLSPRGSSGVTSWTTNHFTAFGYGSGQVSIAAVPVERILSWDMAGAVASTEGDGVEVLVAPASMVRKARDGVLPAGERIGARTASAVIELACHSKECAPPPVGRGGSLPGGMDPVWGIPPEPGTAELESGEFLAYHYTSSDEALESILKDGVRLDTRERRPTEEGAAVWASFERPQPGKPYVEFKVRREDMYIGQPNDEEGMEGAVARGSNFTMARGEIPTDRITTWSNRTIEDRRMWKRELSDADEAWKRTVLNGGYEGVGEVEKARQVLANEFGSPGWAAKPSGVSDTTAVKRSSVPRIDTDRLQRRADRLRSEIDGGTVFPGGRAGFWHRAAELTAIESELVKRGSLSVEDRRTSVVAGLLPLVAACYSKECAPPPVGSGGSSPKARSMSVPHRLNKSLKVDENRAEFDRVNAEVEKIRVQLGAHDPIGTEEDRALLTQSYIGVGRHPYAFEQGLDRAVVVDTVLGHDTTRHFNPTGDVSNTGWARTATTEAAQMSRKTLLDAGFKLDDKILLFRGTNHPANPFRDDPTVMDPIEDQGGASGITSWTASKEIASGYGRTLVVAAVPVRQILSWDQVGLQYSASGWGGEVLVAPESVVTNVLEGVYPAGKRIYPAGAVSAGAGCQSAECAPPPVGTGGSRPGGGSAGLRERVREMVEDAAAGVDVSVMHARNMLASREKALGFKELDEANRGLDDEMQAERDAFAEVVPLKEGFVRRGSAEADALVRRVGDVFPSARVGLFGDVHVEAVESLMDGAELFPPEVREKVKGVALGYTEDTSHVAAFGPHGGGLQAPFHSQWTLWFGPKAVAPAKGAANPDGTSVITTVGGFNRHRLVAVHEMGHVVHNMAAERAWKQEGLRVDTRNDPSVPAVATTRYGETNNGERVAETFALAARDTVEGIDPDQRALVESVLDRAGLSPDSLEFAAVGEGEYEVQFWGDDFGLDPEALGAAGCQDASCAPPPVGVGGSKPGGRVGRGQPRRVSKIIPMKTYEEAVALGDYYDGSGDPAIRAYEAIVKDPEGAELVAYARRVSSWIHTRYIAGEGSFQDKYDKVVNGIKDGWLDPSEEETDTSGTDTESWRFAQGLRGVFSATLKSANPDLKIVDLMQRMHRTTVEHLGGEDVAIELGRTYSADAGGPFGGNNPTKFGLYRYGERAGSRVTSWADSHLSQGWGELDARQTFGMDQMLFRQGSIPGEYLIAENPKVIERLMEGVGSAPFVRLDEGIYDPSSGTYSRRGKPQQFVVASALTELACRDASCAPPPVGTGGSKPSGKHWTLVDDYSPWAGEEVEEAYKKWMRTPKGDALIRRADAIGSRMNYLMSQRVDNPMDQADAYQEAIKHTDANGTRTDPISRVAWYRGSLRTVVSATVKSENPDPQMLELIRSLHGITVESLGGPGSTIELSRSYDGEAPSDGNNPARYGLGRDGDKSSSGLTSWTVNDGEANERWGKHIVTQVFPVEQVLMRQGSITGEFLVGDSVERVQEIVNRGVTASSVIELACRDAACAPPPVGTGGSLPKTGGRTALIDGEAEDLSSMIEDEYGEIWSDIPEVIERAYHIKLLMEGRMATEDQADAYVHAIEDLDGSEDEPPAVPYIDESNWWTELRAVVSATIKSETPDSDVQLLIQRMHEATQAVYRREGVGFVQAARSFDPSYGPLSGNDNAAQLYGRRAGDDATPSSGVTSWATNYVSAGGWGGASVEETFPVEQILMREGSIDGELLIGESVERVREIVGR